MSARVVHKIERFFLLTVCVCVWLCFSKQKFSVTFFFIRLKHHHSALYIALRTLFRVGLNLATFRILKFKYLRLMFVCLLVVDCVYVCVSLESGFVLFVLYLCWCLCTRQILRVNSSKTFSPQNYKLLFQGGA